MKKGWVPAHGRIGYQINHIAHRTDAAITMTSSKSMVAEQMTYLRGHKALTDTFGVWSPARSFGFAAVDTTGASRDTLNLFNPGAEPLPVVVQYMTTDGTVVQRTYIVNPKSHLQVSVGSVLPNAKLGIFATSSGSFVALNRQTMNNNGNASASTGMAW